MNRARIIAVTALIKAENDGYSNIVLHSALKKENLSVQDKAFCSRIFLGVIERKRLLDFILQPFIRKPINKLDLPVVSILRAGAYEILFMSIPKRATVHEAVDLSRFFKVQSAGGLINAILRKIEPHLLQEAEKARPEIYYSVSDSVFNLIKTSYPDKFREILTLSYSKPKLCARTNTLRTSTKQLAEQLIQESLHCEEGLVPDSIVFNEGLDVTSNTLFNKGLFHIQGMSSQYAVQCLFVEPKMKIVDLCSAPGGKSITAAEIGQDSCQMILNELQESRISLINASLNRMGIHNSTVCCSDASVYNNKFTEADRVLCDVPCSGLGVLSKKPDIRYKDLSNLEALYEIQYSILHTASQYCKKNGIIVYSTCTINKSENQGIVKKFLSNHSDFMVIEPPFVVPGSQIDDYGITLFPDGVLWDGFFISILKRV